MIRKSLKNFLVCSDNWFKLVSGTLNKTPSNGVWAKLENKCKGNAIRTCPNFRWASRRTGSSINKNSRKFRRQHWRNWNRASIRMTTNGRNGTKKLARLYSLILWSTTPFLPMSSALRTLRRPSRTTQWDSERRWLISTKQNTWTNPKSDRFLKKDIPKWSLTSFLFRNTLSSYSRKWKTFKI